MTCLVTVMCHCNRLSWLFWRLIWLHFSVYRYTVCSRLRLRVGHPVHSACLHSCSPWNDVLEGDLILRRTPILKFYILHSTDYFAQGRRSTRARTLSLFSKKFIIKIIQDLYFDIILIINGISYFQDMGSNKAKRQVAAFSAMLPAS